MTFQKTITNLLIALTITLATSCNQESESIRHEIPLNNNWRSIANDTNRQAHSGFESVDYDDSEWLAVDVPHNWDQYHGYLRKVHGNRHGYAWYRKSFEVEKRSGTDRYFLWFEGVGSYATVWLNGEKVGTHAGGRTTFTIDITDAVAFDRPNILAVRADHPSEIRDLPWVCGGCSDEWGFSEGSQPMGIFRPVHLIITDALRIEPFGVHIWNDTTVNEDQALININTEIKNYGAEDRTFTLINRLLDQEGNEILSTKTNTELSAGQTKKIEQHDLQVHDPTLWSLEDPYLYTVHSKIMAEDEPIDETKTEYGIRWVRWPKSTNAQTNQFLLNGKPVFINGIGEYEHMLGGSHAFTEEQVKARFEQIRAAGFNAFRDAHQPHNHRYHKHFNREGMLWWTQMGAHIWFDNPDFRENFKSLLRDWVKERRNSPANIMWGLQNESSLPTEFARECTEIIRELDPTTSSQRLVTTCNGGTGTDWNVIQNWSGTYGGDPTIYDEELSDILLNGEYGAWRSIDLHTEGPFDQDGILSENRMTQLMEMKVRLGESVRDQVCGQFMWLLSSHDNPGRIQNGEGLRNIDRLGPVNYKGLLTPWGEPLDVYYMYRSNYAPKDAEPMVYIVSHTWPNRWTEPGMKDSIVVYSNCEEVELFNDINNESLGKRKNPGIGRPFMWEKADMNYNVLQAKGYINDQVVAEDVVVLHHLPESPHFSLLKQDAEPVTKPEPGYHYLYRVNCGGPEYIDENGNKWLADRNQTSKENWGSRSWTDQFDNLPPFYGSQRRTFDPISGTNDWDLLQTFRYGLHELEFNFPVPDGEYLVELYFIEPWYGTGGGLNCEGWRIFDVAVNNITVMDDLDIWKEARHDKVLKKQVTAHVTDGVLRVHFPQAKAGQAILSAVAIASENEGIQAAEPSRLNISQFRVNNQVEDKKWQVKTWLDIGDRQYSDDQVQFSELPPALFASEWIQTPANIPSSSQHLASFTCRQTSDVFIAVHESVNDLPQWLHDYDKSPLTLGNDNPEDPVYHLYARRVAGGDTILLHHLNTGQPHPMYTTFVAPVYALDAPADQRPTKTYEAEDARISQASHRKNKEKDRGFVEIIRPVEGAITWDVSVGLASKYAIRMKFKNETDQPVTQQMTILNSEGIPMSEKKLEFEPTGNRWRTLKTTTGTQINAGNYRLILKNQPSAKGLKIDALYVQ